MIRRNVVVILSLFFAMNTLGQDQTNRWETRKDDIYIYPTNSQNGKCIRIRFYKPDIVRITSFPERQYAEKIGDTSLMVVAYPQKVQYTTLQYNDSLRIKSTALNMVVCLSNGVIDYKDKNNIELLHEVVNDPLFEKTVTEGQPVYVINKSFQMRKEDAYYGLGQHQDEQYNHKNRQVYFFQNNTSVAVPFLLSKNGYGILWDNYSLTKVGDTRSWLPISKLKLYNLNAQQGWLSQTFYNDKNNLQTSLLTRASSQIDVAYLGDSKKEFPVDFNPRKGLILYEGQISSSFSGVHKFNLTYAGYVKIYINGKEVFNKWHQAWNPGAGLIELDLEKNKKYPIKIEWTPDGSESYFTFNWLPPIPEESTDQFSFSSNAALKSDYYFVKANSADSVIAGYRFLTGKAQMFPKWAFGFWQSRERYKTQEELLHVVKQFRQKHIPIDNIVQDWSYWREKDWGSQEFDSSRFPDPKLMIDSLHNSYNAQLMISVWPKFYTGIEAYNEFQNKSWLYGRNVADSQRDWIGNGYISTFYDAFNKDARKGFWSLLSKKLYPLGIDAWWMDASEPDINSNVSAEKRIEQMQPTALGPSELWLNAYPLENARGIYEGQRSESNKRVFLLTRSGFGGSQRYGAAIWSGDIASRWEDMKAQITAGLNFSMSGLPYWTMDAGGFSVESRFEHPNATDYNEWIELQTRWYQFSAFTPLFRVHGQYPYREIFNIAKEGSPAYNSMLYYDKLRYKLMPYIYSLAGAVYFKDYTIMRGLVMDYSQDDKTIDLGDEFMFGSAFLVSPVYKYKQSIKKIYLPKGNAWYDFNMGKYYQGGSSLDYSTDVDKIPLFVKAGAIIPTGPDMEYVGQKKSDPLTVYVFEGANGTFDLYEDDELDYNYEKNQYTIISFNYNDISKEITIEKRKGVFSGMLKERTIKVVLIKKGINGTVFQNTSGKTVKYNGDKISIQL